MTYLPHAMLLGIFAFNVFLEIEFDELIELAVSTEQRPNNTTN